MIFDLWWFLGLFYKICVRFSWTQCWCPHFHTWTWPSWIRTQSFWLILRWGGVKSHHIFGGWTSTNLSDFGRMSRVFTHSHMGMNIINVEKHDLPCFGQGLRYIKGSCPGQTNPQKRLMTQATAQEHHLVDRIWCGCQNWLKAWFI